MISNSNLFCSYNIISSLLEKFGLIVEHRKTEVFHFSRSYSIFDSPPLDLSPLGGLILKPKNTWHYLRFIFNRKLTFQQHIDFYSNKAISMIKCMKMLGNSFRGLIPTQKRLLYRSCILPIIPYSFQMWYYNKVSLLYLLKVLRNMQRRAVLWILDAFCNSPSASIKAIVGLISIHLYLQKLNGRFHFRAHTLLMNHIIKLLLEIRSMNDKDTHQLLLERLTPRQQANIRGPVINMGNRFNKIFPSFSSLNHEFSLGNRLIDIFPSQFSFHSINRKSKGSIKTHLEKLNDITL